MAGKILVETKGSAGYVIFSNPEKRNALSGEMMKDACLAIEQFATAANVRAVVLRGTGKTFVSGADIGGLPTSAEERRPASGPSIIETVRHLDKPVIAVLEGWCLGGGVIVALAADMRIGTPELQLGIPAARLGAGYPLQAVEALVRLVGPSMSSRLLLTGKPIDGRRAYQVGLLDWLAEGSELEQELESVLGSLSDAAPLTLKASKRSIVALSSSYDERLYNSATEAIDECWRSEDLKEGQRAFLAKRKARFTGR
jgi:enoyl-CoA hydratase